MHLCLHNTATVVYFLFIATARHMIRYIHSIYAFMSYDLIDQYRDKQQEDEFVEKDNLLRSSFFYDHIDNTEDNIAICDKDGNSSDFHFNENDDKDGNDDDNYDICT